MRGFTVLCQHRFQILKKVGVTFIDLAINLNSFKETFAIIYAIISYDSAVGFSEIFKYFRN